MLTLTQGKKNNFIELVIDGKKIGKLYYKLLRHHMFGKVSDIEPTQTSIIENNKVKVIFSNDAELLDKFNYEQNLITIEREWIIKTKGKYQLMFQYAPDTTKNKVKEWIVPSVMYQQNKFGEGKFPRGDWYDGWSFREDRMPIPSCSILKTDTGYVSAFNSPANEHKVTSSIKTFELNNKPRFQINIPYTEEPHSYLEKGIIIGGLSKPKIKTLKIKRKQIPYTYKRTFYIKQQNTNQSTNMIIKQIFNDAWKIQNSKKPEIDWNKTVSLRLNHLLFLLIQNSDSGMYAVKMGRGNGLFQGYYDYTAGSFLVKSLEASVIFAKVGRELDNDKLINLAEKIGNYFLKGKLPNGLHQDMVDLKNGRFGGYLGAGGKEEWADGVNTRCNGEVMYNYLRLYSILKDEGKTHNEYLDLVKENSNFYLENQLKGKDEGSFGRWWTKEGVPLNTLGTNGAYIISQLIELDKITGENNPKIKESLKKAGKYYSELVKQNAFYADTLDADCIDKEAGCSLLRCFLDLYDYTQNDEYLIMAKESAAFILSWLWTYDIAWADNTPAKKNNLFTKGLTGVSVAHHHLDFYGAYIGYDFLRLWKYANEEEWKDYAISMIEACSQLIAIDENNYLGRNKNYLGWQPEQINNTNWNYKHHILGTKGYFDVCVAWNTVLELGALLDIRKDFSNLINFKFNVNYIPLLHSL